jgi:uncharacterized protein YjbI with pentapeptide repeats
MANQIQVALIRRGVEAWNTWRKENPTTPIDLSGADLNYINLSNDPKNLSDDPNFCIDLATTENSAVNLDGIQLYWAHLRGAQLAGASIRNANLQIIDLSTANLQGAQLQETDLAGAYLRLADLSDAVLFKAKLLGVNFNWAKLIRANLEQTNLRNAVLVDTNLTGAKLNGSCVYGASVWNAVTRDVEQQNLVITDPRENASITVDNIEVAQFIYLLLHNEKIRDVIDTIGKKGVLILGRFTSDRKKVLDAIREELRKRDYLPILFDFDKPASRDLIATVSTLAHLARFVIADITDPSSIPYELATVVPTTPVPVQPILLSGRREFAMFENLRQRYHWVLTTHRYASQEELIGELGEKVIRPAELKVLDLRGAKPE